MPDGYETTISELAPEICFVSWKEVSGATVTHVDDFERGILLSNATLPDGTFLNMNGTIRPVDSGAVDEEFSLVTDGTGLVGRIVIAAKLSIPISIMFPSM